jgi:hypothetical protein
VDNRLIKNRFGGELGSLHGFGKDIFFASFQDVGTWEGQMQWIMKCVRYTSGPLGKYLRHSFCMPSIPQAFPCFRELLISISHMVLFFLKSSQAKVFIRPMVSRTVCPGARLLSGTLFQFFLYFPLNLSRNSCGFGIIGYRAWTERGLVYIVYTFLNCVKHR